MGATVYYYRGGTVALSRGTRLDITDMGGRVIRTRDRLALHVKEIAKMCVSECDGGNGFGPGLFFRSDPKITFRWSSNAKRDDARFDWLPVEGVPNLYRGTERK